MKPYTELDALYGVYLEDSWVLDIVARPGTIQFDLDLVLAPDHPDYAPPSPGEQHCYRSARLEFSGVTSLTWEKQGAAPAVDATGAVDYGNIDAFEWDDHVFELEGSWGRAHIRADVVQVELEPRGN